MSRASSAAISPGPGRDRPSPARRRRLASPIRPGPPAASGRGADRRRHAQPSRSWQARCAQEPSPNGTPSARQSTGWPQCLHRSAASGTGAGATRCGGGPRAADQPTSGGRPRPSTPGARTRRRGRRRSQVDGAGAEPAGGPRRGLGPGRGSRAGPAAAAAAGAQTSWARLGVGGRRRPAARPRRPGSALQVRAVERAGEPQLVHRGAREEVEEAGEGGHVVRSTAGSGAAAWQVPAPGFSPGGLG